MFLDLSFPLNISEAYVADDTDLKLQTKTIKAESMHTFEQGFCDDKRHCIFKSQVDNKYDSLIAKRGKSFGGPVNIKEATDLCWKELDPAHPLICSMLIDYA